jgi:cation transport regulator
MPYKDVAELPDSVKNSLPKHAQVIYLAAYNNASEQYADPEKRRGAASLEEVPTRLPGQQLKRTIRKTIKQASGKGSNL